MPVGDGTYVVKEMPGPQNMLQWMSSWKVYKVALIMLDVVSLAALQLYEKTIGKVGHAVAQMLAPHRAGGRQGSG